MKSEPIVEFKKNAGFTLIELLVVISIIAILMAIMMPALNKVRQSARITICGNNLKQICIGLNLYASDHGQYPSRKVGFPRLAARKVNGSVSNPDLRKMVTNYIANDASGLLHCPAVRSRDPQAWPGIVENAVYSNHIDSEDRAIWSKYFTIASVDPVTGESWGGQPAYMMTYNIFAGLEEDSSYAAGIKYDWKDSGNSIITRSPKIQGSSKDVIATDMQERWAANADTLSRSNHSVHWERTGAPNNRINFVSSNTAFGDGHVELRKELRNWVGRTMSGRSSRFDY